VERGGKQVPQKVGMAPIQRDGFEYEFDVFLDMDIENNAIVTKTRCPALTGKVFSKPGADVAIILKEWLQGESIKDEPQNGKEPSPSPDPVQVANDDLFGEETPPSPTAQAAQANRKPSEKMIRKLHASGRSYYGNEWGDKRPDLISAVTKGRSDKTEHLTFDECKQLIDGIEKKANEAAE